MSSCLGSATTWRACTALSLSFSPSDALFRSHNKQRVRQEATAKNNENATSFASHLLALFRSAYSKLCPTLDGDFGSPRESAAKYFPVFFFFLFLLKLLFSVFVVIAAAVAAVVVFGVVLAGFADSRGGCWQKVLK